MQLGPNNFCLIKLYPCKPVLSEVRTVTVSETYSLLREVKTKSEDIKNGTGWVINFVKPNTFLT